MRYGLTTNDIYSQIEMNSMSIAGRAVTIGKILKSLRKGAGLTQKETAQIVGTARQTYAGYESGEHEPSIELLIRIANIYSVTMDYITGRNIDDEDNIDDWEWLSEALPHIKRQFESEREFTKMILKQKNTAPTDAGA